LHEGYAYGSWGIAVTIINLSLFFILKFMPMRTKLDKRSGGAFVAFIFALFTEMYGLCLQAKLFRPVGQTPASLLL